MIQEKSYYIIKVETKSGCYYKIGEGYKISRPNILIEKYNKLRANKAELLTFETLPHNSKKRLNDKTIHTKIDSTKMKKADPIYIEHYLGETDGKEEFFELVDKSLDVVEYIRAIISSCNSKDYTASVKKIIDLDFKDKYHLVNNEIIEKIEKKFPEVDDILFNLQADNILLIGQFEPDFVASFAMHNNVTIWHDTVEQRHAFTYSKLNNNIKYFEGTLEEFIEEIKDMNIDLIIANPPYGKVGANITKEIIDNVDFKEYINLLPANDYKRNDSKDLFNYQSEMEQIEGGFEDASVTTHLALIHKVKINNLTSDEFEISNYTNKHLDKYFLLNTQRKLIYNILQNTISEDATLSFFVPMRLSSGDHSGEHHLPYSKDCLSYKVNTNQLTYSEAAARYASHYDYTGDAHGNYFPGNSILFTSSSSKLNFSNFVYSQSGFKFISCILTAIHKDSRVPVNSWFPKVDWTRSWTVEEILVDYGYTEDEIKAVMEDLVNYKGMED